MVSSYNSYNTGPDEPVQGYRTGAFRRRNTGLNTLFPPSKPNLNGCSPDQSPVPNYKATSTTPGCKTFSQPRRPSILNTTRRRLPWLDEKKAYKMPGSFDFDNEAASATPSSASSSVDIRPGRAEPSSFLELGASKRPSAVNEGYTPSIYSAAGESDTSIGPLAKSPTLPKTYNVLEQSPGTVDNAQKRRRSSDFANFAKLHAPLGDSAASPLSSVSPVPLSPIARKPISDEDDMPKRRASEAGLRIAIHGMEGLMQQALGVAQDATYHRSFEGVSAVSNEASRPVQESDSLESKMAPLRVSDSLESMPESLSTESESSYSPRSSPSSHSAIPGDSAATENANPYDGRQSVGSIATDWAYVKPEPIPRESSSSPSSSSSSATATPSDIERQESPHWRAWHDNPRRSLFHTPPRTGDHTKTTHTPPTRREVHENIKHHGIPPIPPRQSSLRHRTTDNPAKPTRRVRLADHGNQIRDRRKERRSERHERYAAPKPRKPQYPWDNSSFSSNPLGTADPRLSHVSYRGAQEVEMYKRHRRQPIARNWGTTKKRITATVACINTSLIGFLIGAYAGEVPRIQYQIADQGHIVILGNVFLYLGLALSTSICWPLPLLHGRKPYTLGALAILLPLQFPQALVVGTQRDPDTSLYRVGLLLPRALSGIVLGFANINCLAILFDLFGVSLQSANPHEELVFISDVRRHGGGMGLWLGLWAWSFLGSIAVGFMVGAVIIKSLDPSWGFYIVVILIAAVLVLNILAPETRRARFRRSTVELIDPNSEYVYQRVGKGELMLHISTEGPKWWGEEVWAGFVLSLRMFFQLGFGILAIYIAWIYAQFVLVIVLLGALLSRDYRFHPHHVGAGVTALAIGALFAVPLSKAGLFSRERTHGPRTDSMTLQRQITWTSHMTRRILFTTLLPFAGLAYTLSSRGPRAPFMLPIAFAAVVGFLSCLALAECHGLLMEAFDTCDLQPGANSRHRLQSLPAPHRRRRTNYSSFPRVSAGVFVAQGLAFVLAAAATAVGGVLTRRLGAQTSTGATAAVLLCLTLCLTAVLWRFRLVKVVPDDALAFGDVGWGKKGAAAGEKKAARGPMMSGAAEGYEGEEEDDDWKPVIIGNPSGRVRRMNVLEMGRWSRWSEIRRLNRLLKEGK